MQPSEWGQFLVGVDYDLTGPARSIRSCQHRSSADMLLLLRMMMKLLLMGGMVITAVTKMTASADRTARSDDHVIVDEVMLGAAHVHLFRSKQNNIANAVHAVRCGYIILAKMSLLQYDQLGRGRAGRRRRSRWRHDRRRR